MGSRTGGRAQTHGMEHDLMGKEVPAHGFEQFGL